MKNIAHLIIIDKNISSVLILRFETPVVKQSNGNNFDANENSNIMLAMSLDYCRSSRIVF